jgi:tetratricopeptide (TPR) repeat protein
MAEAEAALRVDELQAAESWLRTALLEGWLVRGALDAADGRLDEAAGSFRRAAASAVETRRALASLAAVELRRGDAGAAVDLLRRLAAEHPADGTIRKLLAQALLLAGEAGEAAQELEDAYAVTGDPEIAFALATGYLRLDRVEPAGELLERLSRERPGAATWVLIGRTYRDHQQPARARAALERALELDPAARRANFYLGTLDLLDSGRDGFDAAAERFRAELGRYPDDPVAHFYLGLVLTEQRRFAEALGHLETAVGRDEIRLDALRYLGRCQLGLDRVDEAVETLRRALELAAADATRPRQRETVHYQLAQALRRQGHEAEAAGHFAAAAGQLARVVADERGELERLIAGTADPGGVAPPPLAVPELDALGDAERQALRDRVETGLARAYFNLGVGQLRAQRFERALAPLGAAAELRPGFPRLAASLGAARFAAGRFEAAAAALEQAVEAEPGDRELRRTLAMAWLNGDSPGRAAALLADDPGRAADRGLQYAYGLALVRSGRAAEAEGVFGRLLAEHADWPELHVVLGQAQAEQGDFAAAEAELEKALELRPDVPEASFTLGDLYLRQGRLDDAERALRAELAHRPADLRSRYHLAVVLDLNRRSEEAVGELETVLRARPDHADARYLLGKIRLAQGAAEEASVQLEAAAALAPDDANIRYQLAQAYQRSGRSEAAAEQLALYRDLKQREARP